MTGSNNMIQTGTTPLLPIALPNGSMFAFTQTVITGVFTLSPLGSFVDVTGLNATITPTASTHTVLVRAFVNFGPSDASNVPMFRLVRGSTPIGVATSPGGRTACTSAFYNLTATTSSMYEVMLEWLDSPSTTSATTYKVQAFTLSTTTLAINSTTLDTNNSGFPRTVSVISLTEIVA